MTTFRELPLSPAIQESLAAARFTTPTPVQAAAIPVAIEGKDVLATAATGTGKTLAFLLPVMQQLENHPTRDIMAVVLVPTRELAMQVIDQYEALRGRKLPAAALVVGGLPERPQLTALRKGVGLMVATPGRLEDFIARRLINLSRVRMLILDEADRMLDMGFVEAIRRIVKVLPTTRQTLCFSATLEASVAHLVKAILRDPVRLAFGSTLKPVENVTIEAIEVHEDRKKEALHHLLSRESGRCLVFARTKRGTERLAKSLIHGGFSAGMIHGDRSQNQRTAALHGFQQGHIQILVATDVASRGIHVQDVAHVINYDLPQIAEDFVHRVGRTARAGQTGKASTLFVRHEASELRKLESTLGIRMNRISLDGGVMQAATSLPTQKARIIPRSVLNTRRTIVRLPGEIFQEESA